MYIYAERNGAAVAVTAADWEFFEALGYETVGVLVKSGEHAIVVSLDEPDSSMAWSGIASETDGTMTKDSNTAKEDFDGADNTEKAYTALGDSDTSHAICYAHLYAKGSKGAGTWYLPAVGEALIIAAYYSEINAALDAVGGTELSTSSYWTSTQYTVTMAWVVNFSTGNVYGASDTAYHKAWGTKYVRAVTAL